MMTITRKTQEKKIVYLSQILKTGLNFEKKKVKSA